MSNSTLSLDQNLSPDSTIRIPLGYNRFATIDAADAWIAVQWRWRAINTKDDKFYAYGHRTIEGEREDVYLHRLLMEPPDGMAVDHINGDSLDCRRANMRICTRTQNIFNRKKQRGSKTVYMGVTEDPRIPGKWYARIMHEGGIIYLGGFDSPESAAEAYDAKAKELRGEFAHLNFPDEVAS